MSHRRDKVGAKSIRSIFFSFTYAYKDDVLGSLVRICQRIMTLLLDTFPTSYKITLCDFSTKNAQLLSKILNDDFDTFLLPQHVHTSVVA